MRVTFKLTRRMFTAIQDDLRRSHPFAFERVGWLRCRVGDAADGGLIVLAHDYHPVADTDYIDDPSVGAMMGAGAIRKALQIALNDRVSIFHVHMHAHPGRPRFSRVDTRETVKFVPDFWSVRPDMPHGAIILSDNAGFGRCWYPTNIISDVSEFIIVGAPHVRVLEEHGKKALAAKFSRA